MRATITFEHNGDIFTYHGADNSQDITGLVALGEKITFSAPVNFVFKDLDGNTYNAYGDDYPDGAAVYRNVAQVDYGQSLSANQIYADAERYLNQYVISVYDEPDSDFQVYGYFGPDGQFHQITSIADYPIFSDAVSSTDGLTYNMAIIYRRYGKTGEEITPTRTINVTTPDGQTTTTQQVVHLQQFHYYDGISGTELSQPEWRVLTGDNPDDNDSWSLLEDSNHSWEDFNIPAVPGYITMLDGIATTNSQIPSAVVNDQTADVTLNVTYQPAETPVTPPQPDDNSGNGTTPDNGNSVVGGSPVVNQPAPVQGKSTNHHSATALPQTGNERSLAALLGLSIASLTMMLGVGMRKRK